MKNIMEDYGTALIYMVLGTTLVGTLYHVINTLTGIR